MRLTLEVQQSGGDAFAEGFLEAVGEGGERRLSHVRLGLLQTYGSWAAISLRLSDENGIERGGYVVGWPVCREGWCCQDRQLGWCRGPRPCGG